MDALIIIGAPAVPAVREALKSPDVYVRLSAASILEQLGPQAQVTVPDLIVLLQDDHPLAREQAAYTLGAIGPVAGDEAGTPLRKASHDPDTLVRTAVSDAMRKIGIAAQPKRFS
jgi:HEAT repeat protein